MGKKYKIIYADPPWQYRVYSKKGQGRSAENHYHTMNIKDIMALPVDKIADKDCILFLWITFPCLKEGIEVMERWGFKYKTCGFNWVKRNKKKNTYFMGLGFWTRSNSEVCLIGTKGQPKRVSKSVPQICDARIMEHSRKPAEIRERIVELCGELPRIELFARDKVKGWDSLGDEIDGKDIREALREVIENNEC
ncbi:DNA methyltransferase [Eubacterium sp. AF17-7]|uniref:MT-A70 family methyltransferase n=1 Tax=Eubacterium sp. AF17-7 TaxID=2293105 RepID=UPI000E47AC8F|nr:MT-A70 family methyltransferase [Eubacterium sp. AF17-7]RGG65687.1 DNA methyltransferase [Eubacterium sp. AF17-7]